MTLGRKSEGTQVRSGGHSAGAGSLMRASEISVMRSHRTGARMTLEGKMGSLTLDVGRWSNCLDRASALPFLDPGR